MRPFLTPTLTLAAIAMSGAAPAFAQDGEWTVKAETSLVASSVDDNNVLAPAGDSILASADLVISRTDTLDSGIQLTWRAEGRLERDAATRPGFIGVLGNCPAVNPACPRVANGAAFLSPISPTSGLAGGGVGPNDDGFFALEGASLSALGPDGEVIIGLNPGVAAIMDARAPSVMNRVSALSPGLDPTGLVVTRARNDVTGSSFKFSYRSPRWLGLQAGVSYTPDASQSGADFDPDFRGPGLASAQLERVWEGALSFARMFAEQDLRVRAAVTYSSAESHSGFAPFGNYEAWGAGLELEHDGWTGGARWLSSNNAWNSGHAGYEAWELGLTREWDEWRVGVEAGQAEDKLTGIKGDSWLLGASRKINDNLELGLAWTSADADLPVPSGLSLGHTNASNDGLILELTVRN